MLAITHNLFKRNVVTANQKHFYALCWYFGICLGIFNGGNVQLDFCSVVRLSLCDRVPVIWGLFSALLPYLLFFALERTWGRILLAVLSFLKAFCYSFSFLLLCRSFGSAGWLISTLCLWCEIVSTVIFYLFLTRGVGWNEKRNLLNYCVCLVATTVIVIVNHYVVIPFWSDLHW